MEKIKYCQGCLELISEEIFNNGKKKCTREGSHFQGKPFTVIMCCSQCNAYYSPNTTHHHFIPGIVHHQTITRIRAVKAQV